MAFKHQLNKIILRCFRLRQPPLTTQPTSVLFICFDALGDLLVTTPLFRELKQHYPKLNIAVVVSRRNKIILQNNPYVTMVYESNAEEYLKNSAERKVICAMRATQYDLIIDLWDRTSFSHLLKLKLIKPRKIIGLRKPKSVEINKSFKTEELGVYDEVIEYTATTFSERMLAVLSYFSITPKMLSYDLFPSEQNNNIAKKILLSNNSFILVNFYGSRTNNTLSEKLRIILIDYLLTHSIENLLLNSANNENHSHWLKTHIQPLNPKRITILPVALSILDIAAISARCQLTITTNTSLLHIAAACQCPVALLQDIERTAEHEQFPAIQKNSTVVFFDHDKFIAPLELFKPLKLFK